MCTQAPLPVTRDGCHPCARTHDGMNTSTPLPPSHKHTHRVQCTTLYVPNLCGTRCCSVSQASKPPHCSAKRDSTGQTPCPWSMDARQLGAALSSYTSPQPRASRDLKGAACHIILALCCAARKTVQQQTTPSAGDHYGGVSGIGRANRSVVHCQLRILAHFIEPEEASDL